MRDVDPALMASIESGYWRPVFGVWLDWSGGEVRYHSRIGETELDGETWIGVGNLGAVDGLAETEGLQVREITLSLTGFLKDQLKKVNNIKVRNRRAEIYIGAVDADEKQIGSLIRVFRGKMRAKAFPIRESSVEAFRHLIQVVLQNHFASVRRRVEVRYEHPRLAALRHETPQWPE